MSADLDALDLETLLRDAVADGRCRNLTLWSTSDHWQANMSTGLNPWKIRADADPVRALKAVLLAGLAPASPASLDMFD